MYLHYNAEFPVHFRLILVLSDDGTFDAKMNTKTKSIQEDNVGNIWVGSLIRCCIRKCNGINFSIFIGCAIIFIPFT